MSADGRRLEIDVGIRVHLVLGLSATARRSWNPSTWSASTGKMQAVRSAASTAHQGHRTIRVALGEAVRRDHLTRNVATIAKASKLEEEEVQAPTEMTRKRRN